MKNNSNSTLPSNLQAQKHWLWLLMLLICFTYKASAQIEVDTDNFVYEQSFDGLGEVANNWNDGATIPHWYAANANGSIQNYRADNGGTAALYSYGTNTDRALGSLAAGSTGDIIYGSLFRNTSITTINSIQLSFKVEHWRRASTSVIGHQRTKVSYAIANTIDVSHPALLNNNSFVDIPEAYLISLDTVSSSASLNGNLVSATVSVTFPVSLPSGWEFFLRFRDEDIVGEFDVGLAVDDLQITFSSVSVPRIVATSGYSVFPYLDMGIVLDIPNENFNYIVPSDAQLADWQLILHEFYDDNNLDDVDASAYGYEVVEFTDLIGRYYQVLRKHNHSGFNWGTYVKFVNAPSNMIIQSPHAVDDNRTGTQGAAVFYLAEARGLMLAGISRCASDQFSNCSGQTDVCSDDHTFEAFRKSDVAHEVNSIFHLATTILATPNPSFVFVQLHGFEQELNDPDFIISCGTLNANLKSVPDYPVIVRESLLNNNENLNIRITHVDTYTKHGGQTNVQGRYLNLYPQNICEDNIEPATVTNRFLHIEQFLSYRKFPNHYPAVADALTVAINENGYQRAALIDNSLFYFEDFTSLYSEVFDHTWGNNLHVPGWFAAGTIDDLFSVYHFSNGQHNHGGIYSFGSDGTAERAFGSIATSASSSAGDIAYGVLFKNTTGVTLYSVELDYDSEQWRDSDKDGIQTVELSYRTAPEIELHPEALLDNSIYTSVPAGDLHSSNLGTGIKELDGNTNAVHITVTIPFVLNDGEELFIRFFDADNTGFDKAMAIDKFTAFFSTEPPLPVDWRYFNVMRKNGRPQLQWGADNEKNCKTYEILRSEDGTHFENLTSIPCKQNPLTNHYDYIDSSPLWQRNVYYKIAQYDEDGEVTYSSVKSFSSTAASKPNVYHKNNELIIDADKEAVLKSVTVLDFMGRIVCNGAPTLENNSHYTITCPLPPNQLLIVQLVFDSNTYVMHMRTSD